MAIKSQKFTREILRILNEYTDEILESIDEKTEKITKEAVKELKSSSPTSVGSTSGRYAASWTFKKKTYYNAPTRFTIYNAKHYRLTHLLEHGHATVGGTKRTKAIPHIKEVEEKAVNAYIEAVEEVIRNGR